MNQSALQLSFFAIGLIEQGIKTWRAAQDNPNMTKEEADFLVSQVQAEALSLSDAWENSRHSNN